MSKNKGKKVAIIATILIAVMYIFVFRSNVFVNFQNMREQIGSSTITDVNQTMYIFTVRYMYARTGKVALNKDVYCYDDGETISLTVPEIEGYTPSVESIDYTIDNSFLDTMKGLENVKVEEQEGFPNIHKIYYTVNYNPSASSYKVNIYKQEVGADGTLDYTLDKSTTYESDVYIGDTVATEAGEIEGYTLNTEKSNLNAEVKKDGADLDLYYDLNQHYLFFDTDGGTNQDAVPIHYGESVQDKLSTVQAPTKSGYVFREWECIENEETSSRATTPDTMPNNDLFFRAIYDEGVASFTIIYYLENTNDSNYTNIGTYIVGVDGDSMVKTGTNIHDIEGIHDIIDNGMRSLKGDEINYFRRNEEMSHDHLDENVNGDGTTNVKVYYDRKRYTLKFMISRLDGGDYKIATATSGSVASSTWQKVNQASTMTVNGTEYKNDEYTITAKYNESLANKWPLITNVNDNGSYHFISWGTDSNSGYYKGHTNHNILGQYFAMSSELIIDPNDESNVHTLIAYWSSANQFYKYHYMFENINQNDTSNSNLYNGKYYTEQGSALVRSTNTRNNQNGPDVWGMKLLGTSYNTNGTNGGTESSPVDIYIYYDRIKYELTFNNVTRDYIPSANMVENLKNYGIYREKNDNGDYKIYAQYGTNISFLQDAWQEWERDLENPFEYVVADEGNVDWSFEGWY